MVSCRQNLAGGGIHGIKMLRFIHRNNKFSVE